jgi:peptidoglycan/LPS O-acetylase OafA/YrhL
VTVGITVQIISLAVVIAQLLMLHDHPLWRWLDHPVLSYLGLISNPMYLYHHLDAAVGRQMMPGSPRWILMIEVVATIVMGSSPRGLGVG